MSQPWAGQTVFITGAASGIARAVARQIAAAGGRVGVCDRNAEGAAQAAAEIVAAGGTATSAAADVCVPEQLTAAFAALEAELGSPQVVVACAGCSAPTLLDDLNPGSDERLFQVNLLGVARTLHAALPGLRRSGGGRFAGVSSLVALRGLPFTGAYCGSKAGIADYLEGLRPWLAAEQIALTVIFPGYVRTPLTEQGAVRPPIRMLEPEAAATYIVKALAAGRPICQFPPGLAWGLRLLRCLPARSYDRLMTRSAARVTHLKY
uniref:SDR family NAD(P)-dependent oxidoreductase n=1 Tax=Schlesneria paludicola TaxID=360056 RepID=A0A7C2JZN9_9PLAN